MAVPENVRTFTEAALEGLRLQTAAHAGSWGLRRGKQHLALHGFEVVQVRLQRSLEGVGLVSVHAEFSEIKHGRAAPGVITMTRDVPECSARDARLSITAGADDLNSPIEYTYGALVPLRSTEWYNWGTGGVGVGFASRGRSLM